MQFVWRPVRRGEIDPELLWFSLSLAGLGFAGMWLAVGLPWPHCLFLSITGHPCLTCGATRSAIQFFHGHFWEALRWNPLAFVAFVAISVFDVYAAIVMVTRAPRLRLTNLTLTEKQAIRLLVLAILALNWIYLLTNSRAYAV